LLAGDALARWRRSLPDVGHKAIARTRFA
jgi:hypothetical protein